MPYAYVLEAETNGAGAGALPVVGALSPPTPPTIDYFKSQDSRFTKLQTTLIGYGHQALLTRPFTDAILLFGDAAFTMKPGHVPGPHINVAAGIGNGQYLNRSTFKVS